MAADAAAQELDWRRQVRKAYYLREENFPGDLEKYNDYLEEVEDLIEQLMNERTRAEGKARLEKLRLQQLPDGRRAAEATTYNLALLDEEEVALGEEMLGSGSSSFAGAATEVRAEPHRHLNLC